MQPKMGQSQALPTMLNQSLWGNKNFLFLWIGYILSNFGFQIYLISLPLLIYDLTHSSLAMSAMRAIDFFPNIFIGIIAGVFVDRFHRKKIILLTTILRIIILGAIIFLLVVDQTQLWHLYILGFVLSAAGFTYGSCYHTVLPQIVSNSELTEANAKTAFADTLVNMIGPGLAGFLIAMYSFHTSFSVYLVCLLIMVILLYFTKIPETKRVEKKEHTSIWKEMKEGIDCLFENKTLLTPTVVVLFSNFAASLVIGVLVFYAADILQASEKQIGLMYSMGALGGLLGSFLISFLRKRFGRGKIYVWCVALEIVSIFVLIFSFTWWMVGFSLIIRYFAVTMSNVVYFTIRQEFTPNHLLGRVFGTTSMMMKLALPLGLLVSGLWAEYLPITGLFISSAIILMILFLVIRRHPFAQVE